MWGSRAQSRMEHGEFGLEAKNETTLSLEMTGTLSRNWETQSSGDTGDKTRPDESNERRDRGPHGTEDAHNPNRRREGKTEEKKGKPKYW